MDVIWQGNAYYMIDIFDDEIQFKANSLGLISIAQQMIYMAYNNLPKGSHVHYNEFLQKSITNIIIEKL